MSKEVTVNKDKRVDKILVALGYDTYEIFYSPMMFPVIGTLLILWVGGGYAIFICYPQWQLFLIVILGLWSCIYYLVSACRSNNFAITSDALVIVNPNFPFKKYNIIPLESITNVNIGEYTSNWRKLLFLLFLNNYIDVQRGNQTTRYYCIWLEADCWEGSFNDKTIDDFASELQRRNVKTILLDTLHA